MIIKNITYKDFNGEKRTEEHCFHIYQNEIVQMEWSTDGGIETRIRKIAAAKDLKAMAETFIGIIKMSYGIKSADGKRFVKSEEAYKDFISSPAYDVLFMELATDEDKMIEFINGLLPDELREEIRKNGGAITKETIEKHMNELEMG